MTLSDSVLPAPLQTPCKSSLIDNDSAETEGDANVPGAQIVLSSYT